MSVAAVNAYVGLHQENVPFVAQVKMHTKTPSASGLLCKFPINDEAPAAETEKPIDKMR
jgi:hypothetical protein